MNYKVGDKIIVYDSNDGVPEFEGIIRHIGSRSPGDGYGNNIIWSNWDRDYNPNYLTFIRLNERPYKIIKCKQSTLPDWF